MVDGAIPFEPCNDPDNTLRATYTFMRLAQGESISSWKLKDSQRLHTLSCVHCQQQPVPLLATRIQQLIRLNGLCEQYIACTTSQGNSSNHIQIVRAGWNSISSSACQHMLAQQSCEGWALRCFVTQSLPVHGYSEFYMRLRRAACSLLGDTIAWSGHCSHVMHTRSLRCSGASNDGVILGVPDPVAVNVCGVFD